MATTVFTLNITKEYSSDSDSLDLVDLWVLFLNDEVRMLFGGSSRLSCFVQIL